MSGTADILAKKKASILEKVEKHVTVNGEMMGNDRRVWNNN